jgi:hypothetical protein
VPIPIPEMRTVFAFIRGRSQVDHQSKSPDGSASFSTYKQFAARLRGLTGEPHIEAKCRAHRLVKHLPTDQFAHVERDRAVVFDGALAF